MIIIQLFSPTVALKHCHTFNPNPLWKRITRLRLESKLMEKMLSLHKQQQTQTTQHKLSRTENRENSTKIS